MKIKNLELFPLINFLEKVDTSAKASRARTKLVKRLRNWGDEYTESQKQIVLENGGEVDENGSVSFIGHEENIPKTSAERTELSLETVNISEDFDGQFKSLKTFFEDWDGVVSAVDASAYDTLLDILEDEKEK